MTAQRFSSDGQGFEERIGVFAATSEQVATAEFVGTPLFPGEGSDMGGILDDLTAIVAAGMTGELGCAVEDADQGFGSDQGQRFTDAVVRDRVVIAVEADVGGLAGSDGAEEIALEAMLRQRQEARSFFLERLRDEAAFWISRDFASMGRRFDPGCELGVEIGEGGEVSGGEERGA
jgi:hypothetical protein